MAHADPTADVARTIIDKYKDAVVTFNVVIKVSGGPFQDDENTELEAQGFVLDASGLIVTTNAAIDPVSMMAGIPGAEERLGKITTKVVSVRILGANGDDIPAKVVLRDTDRNLAFIRPLTPPATPPAFVDLKTAGPAKVGDGVYVVSKMGKSGNRGPQIGFTRVSGQIERPRLVYVIQPVSGAGSPGNLVFNDQGQPLGLLNFRLSASRRSSFAFGGSDSLEVVIPADDVAEIAQEAPQVKDVKEAPEPAKKVEAPATSTAAPKAGAAKPKFDARPFKATGAEVTAAGGLRYQDMTLGTGRVVKAGDVVSVWYTGTLKDGTKFDSSRDRGEPFSFTLGVGEVMPGWDKGIAGMKVGGRRLLIIPPGLGYGSTAAGPIPANSTLKFDVEIVDAKPGKG